MIPNILKKGDLISVIAPSDTADKDDRIYLEKSKKLFEDLGFRVKFEKNIFSNTLGYGATVEEKIEDLHSAFSNKDVKAIFCVKGGENSNSLFDYIDYDLIKNNPKIISGFSDNTSLLNIINYKTGLITYHGPTFKSLTSWETDYAFKESVKWFVDGKKEIGERNDEYIVLNRGKAEGVLVGGNLSMITKMVSGKHKIDFKDKILFIEELGLEDVPALLSNNLYIMKQNGIFDEIAGLWIGNYESEEGITIEEIVMEVIKDKKNKFPIIKSNNFGHIDKKSIIPIGATAVLDTENEIKVGVL